MTALAGRRILLVEDEFLIAVMAMDMLEELGAVIVGPAASLAQALALARTEALDAAVLDLNLNGEQSEPVADALAARGVPFVIATGYGAAARRCAPGAPVIDKPYTRERLAHFLQSVLCAPAGR